MNDYCLLEDVDENIVLIISDKTVSSDPPWCKYVNEDTECEDSLAKEMCIKACRKLEGNYFDTFICKFYNTLV